MCSVCIERAKGTITVKEALSAMTEIVQVQFDKENGLTEEEITHFTDLQKKLQEEEANEKQV